MLVAGNCAVRVVRLAVDHGAAEAIVSYRLTRHLWELALYG